MNGWIGRELAGSRGSRPISVSEAADHVAVPDTDSLYAFVIDRLTERAEIADVGTSVVYEHLRRPVIEA